MVRSLIGELFEKEYFSLKRYIRSRFHQLNDYDAEDIIQQTVLKLLCKGNDAFSITNMTSYMYASLRNGAIDYVKKRKYEVLCDENIEVLTQSTEELVLNTELKKLIKDAINSLDPVSKYVFIETEMKDRSYRELANETGIRLGTLLSKKSRAMKKLAAILKDYINKEI